MSSINLLPKNIKSKMELAKKENSGVVFAASLSMIMLSVVFFIGLYVNNYYSSKEINALNSKVKAAGEEIEKKVSGNKFLIAEVKAKNNNLLLAKHTYFTKALNLIRNNLVMGVYLDELSISKEKGIVVFKFNGVAIDYQSIMSQMYIFKNLPDVESADIAKISVNDEGYESFEGVLKFKEKILFYKK